MFVTKEDNLKQAINFWQGKPSGGIMWIIDAETSTMDSVLQQAGYEPGCHNHAAFLQRQGCLIWGALVDPTEVSSDFVEVIEKKQGDILNVEYRSPAGMLTENRKDGQIVKYKVNTPDELRILIKIWHNIVITPAMEKFDAIKQRDKDKWPVLVSSGQPSAVQHMLQHETGVAGFWYLLMDDAGLLEEAMSVWQHNLQKKYQIMQTVSADGWYQAENTSTTMISPDYYEKYSLEHMRCFAEAAKKAKCRSLVHMCGLLHDLMPLIKRTGMDGIHALSPPTIGDTPFEYAYDMMPDDFFALGRFGSLNWIDKTREEILLNLADILPHHIYPKHAFALLVTSDAAEFTLENLLLLRDCINEYEREI